MGPEPWKAVYVQPCRRPTDGRYGENPNRLQHYYQLQALLKPSPDNIQDLYMGSLQALGVERKKNDIKFVDDNWESPSLGAAGVGWEVWLNGMEISQFTYFQQIGGIDCNPVSGELTYGLERIAMHLQSVDNLYDIKWNDDITYGEIYLQNEEEREWLLKKVDVTEKKYFKRKVATPEEGSVPKPPAEFSFPKSSEKTKTLNYIQNNVHDFAWFADKRFHVLRGMVELPHSKDSVETWVMFTDKEAYLWKDAIPYMNRSIYSYSLWNGDYPYKQATALFGALSAGGGMEYPNVTVIGSSGSAASLELVIVHEVGHNWFQGILGFNERDQPAMDEGINSFNELRYVETVSYTHLTLPTIYSV